MNLREMNSRSTLTFLYAGRSCKVRKIDPSEPDKILKKAWENLGQEIFDQLEDSKVFTDEQLETFSMMQDPVFLSYLTVE